MKFRSRKEDQRITLFNVWNHFRCILNELHTFIYLDIYVHFVLFTLYK